MKVFRMAAIILAVLLVTLLSGCPQPMDATTETQDAPPASSPDGANAPDGQDTAQEETMQLQPVPVYPAYFTANQGSPAQVYGIPATLQGLHDKKKIDFKQDTGDPAPVVDFFIDGGYIYLTVFYMTSPVVEGDPPIEHTEYFRQAVGSQTIGSASTLPGKPDAARVTASLNGFTVEQSTYEGDPVSEIWNTADQFVTSATPNGAGPFRFSMVHGAARLDNGLLFATGNAGLMFLPAERTSTNEIAGIGRLWQ